MIRLAMLVDDFRLFTSSTLQRYNVATTLFQWSLTNCVTRRKHCMNLGKVKLSLIFTKLHSLKLLYQVMTSMPITRKCAYHTRWHSSCRIQLQTSRRTMNHQLRKEEWISFNRKICLRKENWCTWLIKVEVRGTRPHDRRALHAACLIPRACGFEKSYEESRKQRRGTSVSL